MRTLLAALLLALGVFAVPSAAAEPLCPLGGDSFCVDLNEDGFPDECAEFCFYVQGPPQEWDVCYRTTVHDPVRCVFGSNDDDA
jgi:hypothetical protein